MAAFSSVNKRWKICVNLRLSTKGCIHSHTCNNSLLLLSQFSVADGLLLFFDRSDSNFAFGQTALVVGAVDDAETEEWPAAELKRAMTTVIRCSWARKSHEKPLNCPFPSPIFARFGVTSQIFPTFRTPLDLPWSAAIRGLVLPTQLPFLIFRNRAYCQLFSGKMEFSSQWKSSETCAVSFLWDWCVWIFKRR